MEVPPFCFVSSVAFDASNKRGTYCLISRYQARIIFLACQSERQERRYGYAGAEGRLRRSFRDRRSYPKQLRWRSAHRLDGAMRLQPFGFSRSDLGFANRLIVGLLERFCMGVEVLSMMGLEGFCHEPFRCDLGDSQFF